MLSPIAAPRAAAPRRRPTAIIGLLASLLLLGACLSPSQGQAHGLVNESRARAGLPGLAHDAQAQAKAQDWANQIAARGSLAHSRLSDGLTGWRMVAENVGYGSSVTAVHRQFLSSSAHRANILGRYTHLGTGVARGHGSTWVVHVFVQR